MKEKECFFAKIKNCLNKNNYALEDSKIEIVWTYFLYLKKINTVKNLISIKLSDDDIIDLFCDSIIAAFAMSYIARDCDIYDIGSGAGFPGVIIAFLNSHKNIFLVESSRKKCSFLISLKSVLSLSNIAVINDRVENISGKKFVISKAAFSSENIGYLKNIIIKNSRVVFLLTYNQIEIFEKALKNLGEFTITIEKYHLNSRDGYLLIGDKK